MVREKWLYAWALGAVAFGVTSLLVPLYVILRGGGAPELGVLAATAGVAGAVGGIMLGRLADTGDRQRQLFLAVLLGSAFALLMIPVAETALPVLVLNGIVWCLFAAAGPAVTMLIVTGAGEDLWHQRIAQLQTFQGYGWAAGLVLGMVWLAVVQRYASPQLAQQSLFVVAALLAATAGVLGRRWLPVPGTGALAERKVQRVARFMVQSTEHVKGATFVLFSPTRLYWTTLTLHPERVRKKFTPNLFRYFIALTVVFTGIGIFFAPLPLFLQQTGYGVDIIFGLYLVSSLGAAVFYRRAGDWTEHTDLRNVQAGALGIRTVLFPLVAVAGTLFAASLLGTAVMTVIFVLIGVTWAFIGVAAITMVTKLAPASIRSECLGMYTGITAIAGAIGSMIGGVLAIKGFTETFLVSGAFLFVGAVIVLKVSIERSETGQ